MRQAQIMAYLRGVELFLDEAFVELFGVLEQVLAEIFHALPLEPGAIAELCEAIHRIAGQTEAGLSPIPLTCGPNGLPDAHTCCQQQEHYKQAGKTQAGSVLSSQLSEPIARSGGTGFNGLL